MWNRKVFIRVIEVLLCISCVVALRVTDDESRRVFHYLRNRSREWSLLNNVTWGTIGAALATATCGGYVIITMGLLVAAATGELRGRITELCLLGLGVVLFGIVGALSLASIDSVPDDLVDNAAVLGALCLLTALVFVVDLLMKIPGAKKKHDGTQTNVDKDFVKIPLATLNGEKETKSTGTGAKTSKPSESKGSVNTGFDPSYEASTTKEALQDENTDEEDENLRSQNGGPERETKTETDMETQRVHRAQRPQSQDFFEAERNRKFEDVGKQLREYTQSLDGSEDLLNPVRYRNAEERNEARREYFENDGSNSYFRNHEVYRRPVDEVDTPLFPTHLDHRNGDPIFAKIVNPGVKIMRVDRDLKEDYRNSDSSQYDNVPTRMRRMSPGILKKNRDVSFNIPPPPKIFGNTDDRHKDDIRRLEECFNALQTSIGTQTGSQKEPDSPSSPTDPGYVRHTVSNWPHDLKAKTPGSSPDHRDKK